MAIDDSAMSAAPGIEEDPDSPHGGRTTAQKNKSRKKAGQAGALTAKDMPDFIANITLPPYEQSMTAVPNDTAYLQPILPHLVEQLRLQDGNIGLGGVGAMIDGMGEEYYFDKSPAALKGLDLITLRAIQTIILTDVQRRAKTPQQIMRLVTDPSHINQVTSIYLPDFLKKIGYNKSHINKTAVEYAIAKIKSYYRLDGIIKEEWGGRTRMSRYAVLNFEHYDDTDGTLHFHSPYIHKLIAMILSDSIRIDDATKLPKTSRNGNAVLRPSYTDTITENLGEEKNKRAAEVVFVVDKLIAMTGSHGTPKIMASTVIERCTELKNALDATASTSDKNKLLRRTFTRAWELLETQTKLKETYRNIRFNTGIPTVTTLDMVFSFPHEGRIKEDGT